MKHFSFLYTVMACLYVNTLQGQYSDSSFVRYTFKDGLSNNYITSIQQDEQGYIWVGTDMGVNRFDGLAFKNLSNDINIQLPSATVKRLKKMDAGKIGILSNKGLHVLNTKDLSFKHYAVPDSGPLSSHRNAAWDAQLFRDGSIGMTTSTGFYVFNKEGDIKLRHDAFKIKDPNERILYGRAILPVSDEDILIYTHRHGLAHYNRRSQIFQELELKNNQWEVFRFQQQDSSTSHSAATRIGPDQYLFFYFYKNALCIYDHKTKREEKTVLPIDGIMHIGWQSSPVAINDSLYAINGSAGGFYTFILDRKTGKIRFNPHRYLPGHTINILFVDREGRLWAGTRDGLLRQRINEDFLKTTKYAPDPGDMALFGSQSAFRYKDKLYLTKYSRSNGLIIIDTATGALIRRLQFYGQNTVWNEVITAMMYHPDTLWLGTGGGPLWLDLKSYNYGKLFEPDKFPFLPRSSVHFHAVNKDGYAWFFYFMEGWAVRYHVASRKMDFFGPTTQPAFPFKKVKNLAYDSFGDVWFSGHSLTRWSSRSERFDTLIKVYGGVNKYNDDILAISADENGSLWLHNAENALLEYRINEKRFIPYTTKDGLPTSVFQCFSPVINDILWIGTANSLIRFNTRTRKSFIYDHNDGFPDESPLVRRIFYDKERNRMYLLCKNYLVQFPAIVSQLAKTSGEVLIQEFRVNDKKIWYHPEESIRLRHNENTIFVQFNIIEFESPNSYQLSYRIDKEEGWTITGPGRSLQFKGLPPGDHVLHIRASGKNGEERIQSLEFTIAKPFWRTNGFLLGAGILLGGIIMYVYRRRLHSIHQKANIDKQLAQTQMKALHAQMNPHFVFNSLNSIREMILNNESKEASHFLSKFAQLMRMTLDHSVKSFISLRSTMEYLERYMEMEQVRNDKFTCRILADEDLDPDETLLPPMLIQPFIENAIWHGVTETKKDININIDFKKEGEQLICVIDDDGLGIDRSMANKKNNVETHTSVGIANIRNRIQLLNEKYGLECSVDIIDKSRLPGQLQGTRVTIRLPLHIDE